MTVRVFNSTEEMFEALEEDMKAADVNVQEWQHDLQVGDCFIERTDLGFNIYAKILEKYTEKRVQYYYLCDAYSVACPMGEKGDIHASTITAKIETWVFEIIVEKLQNGG